jgi:hypothetical protein
MHTSIDEGCKLNYNFGDGYGIKAIKGGDIICKMKYILKY